MGSNIQYETAETLVSDGFRGEKRSEGLTPREQGEEETQATTVQGLQGEVWRNSSQKHSPLCCSLENHSST